MGLNSPIDDVSNSASSQSLVYGESQQQSHFVFEDAVNDLAAAQLDFLQPAVEVPPIPESSLSEAVTPGFSDVCFDAIQPLDAPNSFPFDLNSDSLQGSSSHGKFQSFASLSSPLLSQRKTPTKALESSVFEGGHIEEVVLPLHLLKIYFPVYLSCESLGEHVRSASPPAELYELVNRMELHRHIEDLLCQSFEESARSIRARQGIKAGPGIDVLNGTTSSHTSIQRSRANTNNCVKQSSQQVLPRKAKVLHHLMWAVSMGTIRLSLTSGEDMPSESGSQSAIHVSFMPRDEKRTTGICINFEGDPDARPRYPLSQCIKTINVIPQNSEIIQCVSRNDVRSLQLLFDKREASALDVDPQGFSLLSVSIPYTSKSVLTIVQRTYYSSSMPCIMDVPKCTCYFYKVEQVPRTVTGKLSRSHFEPHILILMNC